MVVCWLCGYIPSPFPIVAFYLLLPFNLTGFDIHVGLEDQFFEAAARLEKTYYHSVKRYYQKAFMKAKLGQSLRIMRWDPQQVFDLFDKNNVRVVS